MTLEITPSGQACGAEIRGVELSAPLPAEIASFQCSLKEMVQDAPQREGAHEFDGIDVSGPPPAKAGERARRAAASTTDVGGGAGTPRDEPPRPTPRSSHESFRMV